VRLLLDTATLIYAVEAPEKLSKRASAALRNPGNVLELSTISITEIAIKQSLDKLKVTTAIVRQAVQGLDIRLLPYTGEHAFRLFELPPHHSDPFDRQIIAQALSEKISVVTPDEKFRLYGGLKIVW
jgi:PIN domain nuclease of toxin-antitoxin system